MKLKIALISLFFSSMFFIWGLGSGLYKWFPFFYLLEVKKFVLLDNETELNQKISIDNIHIQNHLNSINESSVLLKRNILYQKILKSNEKVIISKKKYKENSDILTTKIYNNEVNAILTYSLKSKNCLNIYIQGHGGNPFNYLYHNQLLKFFINEGCDVLSMSMTGLGLNEGEFSYPSKHGIINLDIEMARNHKNYAFFFDDKNPDLDPLTIFLKPHYDIIKSLSSRYDNISMIGISGGGWYTVWLSALISEIDFSISYAGSLPIEYRKYDGVSGDWEQQNSQIYNFVSYWELYKLMTIDDNKKQNRKSILIYNDKDDCCFYNPYAEDFKFKIDSVNWKNLDIIIDKNDTHTMNVNLIKKLYKINYLKN
jgi:hypothetical protein